MIAAVLAAAPAGAADPVMIAVGDVACDPADGAYNGGMGTVDPAPGRCHQKDTSDIAVAARPALTNVLALGDLQYENGALAKFNASYDPTWGRVRDVTKPVPGNHEYGANGSDFDANATGYFTYFRDQLAAEGPDAGDPQRGWYSYDVQAGGTSWHIVALNSECAAGLRVQVGWEGDCAAGSEQEQWLRTDLAANTSDCTLAYWHHPRFSSGDIGDNPIMAPIWNALYEDHADIVLAGHDHHYERLAQAGPTGAREPGRGIRSWVVGTGGKNLKPIPSALPASDVRDNTSHGVLQLTLHGAVPAHPRGWYEWEFAGDGRSASTFTDSGAGDCVGPPVQPTPTTTTTTTTPAAAPPPAVGPSANTADRIRPVISRARLSRSRFRVGARATAISTVARGTTVAYSLSEPVTAVFRIDRRVSVRRGTRRVVRYRRAGTLRRSGSAGPRRVPFSGRIGSKPLRPGRYRLTISARDGASNAGRRRVLRFTVLR